MADVIAAMLMMVAVGIYISVCVDAVRLRREDQAAQRRRRDLQDLQARARHARQQIDRDYDKAIRDLLRAFHEGGPR